MPRFTIEGDPIHVAFGYDEDPNGPGVFLSVFDNRLCYDPNATSSVNAVTESIGVKDGGGSYFDLHTGRFGFGVRVDHETMATFVKKIWGVRRSNPFASAQVGAASYQYNTTTVSTLLWCWYEMY